MVYEPKPGAHGGESAALDGMVDLARDRDLVERCQGGDESAFSELYHRYHRRLHRFCLRRLHEADDADEAVQEAFTRAWRALPRFGGERRFYPWLTVIAGNVCTDMLRRRSRVVPMDELPLRTIDLGEAEIDEQLLRQVDLAMATEALGHLSDRHQRVLRLREASGWSAQRIAEHEGVAVPAVDTLLWRARQAFKREFAALSDTGGGLAAALGAGLVGLRRLLARSTTRVGSRVASLGPLPGRGPGVLVASVAITGAAIAGGSIALVGAGHSPSHPVTASNSSLTGPGTSAATRSSGSADGGGAGGSGTGTRGQSHPNGAGNASNGAPGGLGVPGAGTGGLPGAPATGSSVGAGAGGATTALGSLLGRVGGLVGGSGTSGTATTPIAGTVNGVTGTVGGIVNTVGGTVGGAVGGLTGSTPTAGSGSGTPTAGSSSGGTPPGGSGSTGGSTGGSAGTPVSTLLGGLTGGL